MILFQMSLLLSLISTIPKLGSRQAAASPTKEFQLANALVLQTQFTSNCNVNTFVICQSCLKLPELSPDKLEVSSPEAPQQPLRPLHPGMLSAALQGTLPPSHQPPTPPRTPQVVCPKQPQNDYNRGNTQGHLSKHQEPASPLSMLPKMPSLLSMAALQQQMLGKPPGEKSAFLEKFPLLTSICALHHHLDRVTCGSAHE